MKYRYLGNTGLPVARIALGTMTFGAAGWGCDQATAHRILAAYLDAGGNFVDTADVYANNESERIIGAFLTGSQRDRLVIASKCYFPQGEWAGFPGCTGLSRKHIMSACEASLKRLGTDHIDLYYAHAWDPNTPPDETMIALDLLMQQGKIRYAGCSNFYAWQFTLANANAAGRARFVCGQHMYNLVRRDIEREVIPACEAQKMSIVAWSPLAGGVLTGKYRRAESPQPGTRLHHRSALDVPRFWHDAGFRTAEIVARIADREGLDRAFVALSWVVGNPAVASVITGVRTVEQLQSNLAVADQDLPPEVYRELCAETEPEEGYLEQNRRHNVEAAFGAFEVG